MTDTLTLALEADSLPVLQSALANLERFYAAGSAIATQQAATFAKSGHVMEAQRNERRAVELDRRVGIVQRLVAQLPAADPPPPALG